MIIEDISKGTFVRFVWQEETKGLLPLFEQLKFQTGGPKHTAKRLLVFRSIIKAAMQDADNQVFWITNRDKHQAEQYGLSLHVVTAVAEALVERGWLSLIPRQVSKDGYARRWLVSDDLLKQVPHGLEWTNLKPERPVLDRHELVKINHRILKRYHLQQGYRLPPPRHTRQQLEEVTSKLEELNSLAFQHTFTGLLSKSGEPREFRGFNRTFSHDLFWAGRTYGGCEQMPEERRFEILIDGEPVVELDIKACQPNILYSRTIEKHLPYEEAPRGGDLYTQVAEKLDYILNRDQVKAVVMKALGNASFPRHRWPYGLKVKGVAWAGVAAVFLQEMPFLDRLRPVEEDTFTLQHTEASILFEAMYRLYKDYGIAVLPVHDALVVSRHQVQTATDMLSKTFWLRTSLVPRIDLKKRATPALEKERISIESRPEDHR
jgi:hypothetical protein